jgi:uncharacterized OsmC-like protein
MRPVSHDDRPAIVTKRPADESPPSGIAVNDIAVTVEGDLDLRGTLGIDREAPVGFTDIRLSFAIDAPGTSEDDLAALRRKPERYCVVMQTLLGPPAVSTTWA